MTRLNQKIMKPLEKHLKLKLPSKIVLGMLAKYYRSGM